MIDICRGCRSVHFVVFKSVRDAVLKNDSFEEERTYTRDLFRDEQSDFTYVIPLCTKRVGRDPRLLRGTIKIYI